MDNFSVGGASARFFRLRGKKGGFKHSKSVALMLTSQHLLKLTTMTMPFGKYQGTRLCALPQAYLVWFSKKGFPKGELGELLELMLEIDHNGLNHLLTPLKNGSHCA